MRSRNRRLARRSRSCDVDDPVVASGVSDASAPVDTMSGVVLVAACSTLPRNADSCPRPEHGLWVKAGSTVRARHGTGGERLQEVKTMLENQYLHGNSLRAMSRSFTRCPSTPMVPWFASRLDNNRAAGKEDRRAITLPQWHTMFAITLVFVSYQSCMLRICFSMVCAHSDSRIQQAAHIRHQPEALTVMDAILGKNSQMTKDLSPFRFCQPLGPVRLACCLMKL